MGLELRQQLKLSQQLVMTPQLQQAIKLLQLSRLELLDTVQQELLENPILEEAEALERTDSPDAESGTATLEDAAISREADWDNYLGEFSSTSKQAGTRESESLEEGMSFEARMTKATTLEGHLAWQMCLSNFTDKEVAIGECIIGNLSNGGFLRIELDEICETCYAEFEDVERVLSRIQRFDPVGVAARTPQECLLIQLEVLRLDDDPILVSLVRDHLEDLEKNRYKPLARKFKLSMEDLKSYLDLMQTLDPLPGASFSGGDSFYVSPDAYVYEYDGDFVIVLNEDGLPKLQMNSFYVETLASTKGEDKEYFQEKMRSAQWLMKSLYQRQRTLYKVLDSIVRFQRGFFQSGVSKLKPLILKEVAEDIEMHESTVSRITTSKYVSTPHGIYELKFFFNSALGLDDGSQVGSESVKALIKKLISEENSKKPLSDEKIAEMLKDELEVNIARRTVAKYRTAMGIRSSSKRKQVF
ncbi:RNA polymerase, sigma 54 subunit, RpoN/SigL [Maridesulfovibrio ferrireducens]|uniref:RNA polymerase, sigma 54 subunit, RpoN/SigL n=1 Tax=Maridesulfovibrio ferrireducens TaxID=246191 RepID=A0A1G9E7G8_9BACT|nr:RNA polymerase factor sigma-54 [Maridesulfovibrio ferrireducens]SDK72005.1 RNA polymerase, sigma 54 subunit, RpoN/SigL [Maridesulfovibrio ferrireducens]